MQKKVDEPKLLEASVQPNENKQKNNNNTWKLHDKTVARERSMKK